MAARHTVTSISHDGLDRLIPLSHEGVSAVVQQMIHGQPETLKA